jgi:hypothetical protein
MESKWLSTVPRACCWLGYVLSTQRTAAIAVGLKQTTSCVGLISLHCWWVKFTPLTAHQAPHYINRHIQAMPSEAAVCGSQQEGPVK